MPHSPRGAWQGAKILQHILTKGFRVFCTEVPQTGKAKFPTTPQEEEVIVSKQQQYEPENDTISETAQLKLELPPSVKSEYCKANISVLNAAAKWW